jgi:hypothetical protein
LVAGGGAGGTRTNVDAIGGGGGAGGIATGTVYLTAATYAIDIGAGGTSATGGNVTGAILVNNGAGTSLGTTAGAITATGGGRGGCARCCLRHLPPLHRSRGETLLQALWSTGPLAQSQPRKSPLPYQPAARLTRKESPYQGGRA